MSAPKTRTEYLTQAKLDEIKKKTPNAIVYTNTYDTPKKQFTAAESREIVEFILKKNSSWRQVEFPNLSNTEFRTWLCCSLKDSPLSTTPEGQEMGRKISTFRDDHPTLFTQITDKELCTPKFVETLMYMLFAREQVEKGKVTPEEADEVVQKHSQDINTYSGVSREEMKRRIEERDKAQAEKIEREKKELMQLLSRGEISK